MSESQTFDGLPASAEPPANINVRPLELRPMVPIKDAPEGADPEDGSEAAFREALRHFEGDTDA